MKPFPDSGWARRLVCLLMALGAAVLFGGCTAMPVDQMPKADGLPLVDDPEAAAESAYRIRPGDDLDIKFFYTRELNEAVKVRPDGFITLQLVDEIKASELTPRQLKDTLIERYAAHLKNPVLSVIVRSFSNYRAYVGGEVGVPQLVPLEGGLTPLQAIFRAGGTRPTADMRYAVLIRKGPDGMPQSYQLDLSDDAVNRGRRDLRVALRPSDVLYIPRSPIANGNLFVQQYIADLLLFRGIQLGFTNNYIYNRDKTSTSTDAPATTSP